MKRSYLFFILALLLFGCSKKVETNSLETSITQIVAEAEYGTKLNINNLFTIKNGKITSNDAIDTLSLGEKTITVNYTDSRNKQKKANYKINIVDHTKPMILNRTNFTIKTGSNEELLNDIICGDNYDRNLVCSITGTYDKNTPGEYNLAFTATDSSGNETNSPFKLIVKDTITTSNSQRDDILLNDIIKNYKTDTSEIGIDVSSWQDDIDWTSVKNSGITFAMIRIGHGKNQDGTYNLDKKFYQNLANAKKAGIKVGIYYYSKANSTSEAIKIADWIVSILNKETLDLPISFDWECWNDFNNMNINYVDLNLIAESFIKEVKKYGYTGMNYGSASYLEKVWNLEDYPTWLAHYTDQTDYSKKYKMWQLGNTGIVPGINGHVDIDILYN